MKSIDELTIREAQERLAEADELRKILGSRPMPTTPIGHPWIGKNVFIRSVTHHYTGHCVAVTDKEIIISDVAWIAENGRFTDALKTGDFDEVEIYPAGEVRVGYGALLDWSLWAHELPREQK